MGNSRGGPFKDGGDYTLMPPYGGETGRGFDTEGTLEARPKMFRGGEADLELVQSYASGDMAVLVAIERQHGEVGGMPVAWDDQRALRRCG
jgi:hypothetical protein